MAINFKKIIVLSFLLTVNFHSLRILVNISCTSLGEEEFYRTNLTIDTADLDFTLLPNGRYTCTFDLNVKGNEYSSHRNSSGIFIIPDDSIIMNYLYFPDRPEEEIDWDPPLGQNNSTTLIFQSNLSLLLGESTRLSGKFEGKCQSNTSDLYTYHFQQQPLLSPLDCISEDYSKLQ